MSRVKGLPGLLCILELDLQRQIGHCVVNKLASQLGQFVSFLLVKRRYRWFRPAPLWSTIPAAGKTTIASARPFDGRSTVASPSNPVRRRSAWRDRRCRCPAHRRTERRHQEYQQHDRKHRAAAIAVGSYALCDGRNFLHAHAESVQLGEQFVLISSMANAWLLRRASRISPEARASVDVSEAT